MNVSRYSLIVNTIQSPKFRVAISSLLSAVTWFCWAYWVNIENREQALLSGFSQGAVNLFTTATGSMALELLYARYGHHNKGKFLAIVSVSTASLLLMLGSHLVAHTPNILMTVLPVYCVVVVYCSAYILGLDKVKKQDEAPAFPL